MLSIIFSILLILSFHSAAGQSNLNTRTKQSCGLQMQKKLLKVEISRLVKNCQRLPKSGRGCHKVPKVTKSCRRLAKLVSIWQTLAKKSKRCKKIKEQQRQNQLQKTAKKPEVHTETKSNVKGIICYLKGGGRTFLC